jgi:TrmH family RNA methyltransferase
VLAAVAMREEEIPEPEQAGSLVLVLDRLQDPGNMGTIIRTADWFGIRHIYCSQDTVEVYNPKVVQSTMGSICRVAVHYVELSSFLANIKGRRTIYGTFINGKSVYDLEPNLPAAVIIGNESQGISGDLLNQIDEKITIPRVNTGAESLNASVAAGIICAEFARKSVVVGH